MSEKTKLPINADDSHWFRFWNELARENRFDEDSLNQYVMQYASSGVTDLLFNIFGQSSNTPTGVLTFRGALYGQTEQHGNPVDYGDYYGLAEFYRNTASISSPSGSKSAVKSASAPGSRFG